ncbi:hypothetical protein [Nonomuraea salmonea]|uniref:hypothetical protein n=1 Tax=Nonomuraea salmonea TaxID=46181 RepID=UPI002FED15E0
MPSGLTGVTEQIYALTETTEITSALARQFLHLACHAENITALSEARRERGIVLDRWWWSTVAYGWYGANLRDLGVDEQAFFGLIKSVWVDLPADLIFFCSPLLFEDDEKKIMIRFFAATRNLLAGMIP